MLDNPATLLCGCPTLSEQRDTVGDAIARYFIAVMRDKLRGRNLAHPDYNNVL